MRKLILVCFIPVTGVGSCQNLVDNGSFEQYTDCPSSFGYAQYATGWENLYTSSADYYNRCQTNLVAGVPFNTCGYQEPADGDGYIGMFTTVLGLSSYREIVGRELTAPLQVGVPLCLSFKLAVGGFGSWSGNSANYTAKGVGLRFFNGFPSDWSAYLYPNSSALALDVVPTDTAIWYTVSGEYTPDSAYTHVAIGNFFADTLSAITVLDTTGYGNSNASYSYLDDVRISYDLEYCGTMGIGTNAGRLIAVRVYPQPFTDRFQVELGRSVKGALHWALSEASGRIILRGSERSGVERFEVFTGSLPAGAYACTIMNDTGAFAPTLLLSVPLNPSIP